MIILLLLIPLFGILAILPSVNVVKIKKTALVSSLITFRVSIVMWREFDENSSDYQFVVSFSDRSILVPRIEKRQNLPIITTSWDIGNSVFLQSNFRIDGISLYFVLLTTFIIPICLLSNWDTIQNIKYFRIRFLLLETLLIAVFTVCDLLLFYIFFESILLPLYLIVGIWGGSGSSRAAFLLFLYTLFGSLFMLLSFLVIYYHVGSTDFTIVSLLTRNLDSQKILWIGIFISMAVKTPLFPFHIWLPRAHSEAPVAGSVLLAGVILKLRLYGYLRILIPFLPDATTYFTPLVQTLAVISILYRSLRTLRQTDYKVLIAYSSVAHVGVMVLGVFSNTIQGIEGAILLGIAHGIVSPALFILVGGVLYDRYHTRILTYYRGLTTYMPIFSIFFFLFTIFNAAVPLSANWIGEILCLTGIFQDNPFITFLRSTGIVLSARYSIWLYNRMAFGSWSYYLTPPYKNADLSRREFRVLLPLLTTRIVVGIYPAIVLNSIHTSVSTLPHKIYICI